MRSLTILVSVTCFAFASSAAAQSCTGDIDGNGVVGIDEVIAIATLAEGGCASSPCPGDSNHDLHVAISELLTVVDESLGDCVRGPVTPTPTRTPTTASRWTPGVFQPSTNYAARCALPRSGIDPIRGEPYPDTNGSTVDENDWLRSWTHETYLWYREVPDLDPSRYETVPYFQLLRTSATTASGRSRDRFHFAIDTAEYWQLSQSGAQVGYGADWAILSGPRFVVAYTEPNSPATSSAVGLQRGALILGVDGVDVMTASTAANMDTVLRGLYPAVEHEQHTFTVLDRGSSFPRTIHMEASVVDAAPVQNVRILSTGTGNVGYFLFNSHIATAEAALIDAVTELRDAGIADLILDLRYNTGGYVIIADELAYMIAGSQRTQGRVFQRDTFNDHYRPQEVPFVSTAVGLSTEDGTPLPSLNLPRVFVLTGPSTCSASESIINSLRGIDVEVVQIGTTTCGKPYVFYPEDNCGTTYFTIQVQAVNHKGFGAFDDGFSPQNISPVTGTLLPGCTVADDFTHLLGDAAEARVAAALNYRILRICPNATRSQRWSEDDLSAIEGELYKPVWDEPRIPARR